MLTQPHERYRGLPEERRFVRRYLAAMRATPIRELLQVPRILPLPEALACLDGWIDPAYFQHACDRAASHLAAIHPGLRLLPPQREIIGVPDPSSEDPGGFHSRHGQGYQDMHLYAFAMLLSPRYTASPRLNTLEVARNYIHDSIHYSQFRVYRRVPPHVTNQRFAIWRAQSGVSFRHPNGISYSARGITQQGPQRINLSLLQDGVTVLLTARALAPLVDQELAQARNDFEHQALTDIAARYELLEDGPARRFHHQVTKPSVAFLRYWAGADWQRCMLRVLAAMLSGRLTEVMPVFEPDRASRGRFKRLFMSPDWITLRGVDRPR